MSRYVPPTEPAVLDKLRWWRDLKFGALLHFSAGSQLGGVESWSLCAEDLPFTQRTGPHSADYDQYKKAYERLPETFDPAAFDAGEWAAAIAGAGMRYAIVPTKHHDGFCMWDTAETDYKITGPGCAYTGGDVLRALTTALRERGLGLGAYFSKPDWHCDDYWWRYFPTPDRHVNYDRQRYPERWRRYVEFTHRQIAEITSGYGPLDILWLDGGWVRPRGVDTDLHIEHIGTRPGLDQDIDMPRLAAIARSAQPGMLVVDRTVHGPYENYLTPEQGIPGQPLADPWESCVTLGEHWYSATPDMAYKSVEEVVRLLITAVARGGNLLLGIGPDSRGRLVPQVRERLAGIGAWLRTNGEAIYGTRAAEPSEVDGVFFTAAKDGSTVYALVPGPASRVEIPLPGPIDDVRVLGQSTTRWKARGAAVTVEVNDPHPAGTAIAIRADGGGFMSTHQRAGRAI
ncbi:alpha-L-fucosidase [Nonomuraea wenchangensis]|uniref:alpha-L-fucosidase n=1 Tax=Nonomuraea wenchangensis TaxID=568860 RepID=UPI00371C8E29